MISSLEPTGRYLARSGSRYRCLAPIRSSLPRPIPHQPLAKIGSLVSKGESTGRVIERIAGSEPSASDCAVAGAIRPVHFGVAARGTTRPRRWPPVERTAQSKRDDRVDSYQRLWTWDSILSPIRSRLLGSALDGYLKEDRIGQTNPGPVALTIVVRDSKFNITALLCQRHAYGKLDLRWRNQLTSGWLQHLSVGLITLLQDIAQRTFGIQLPVGRHFERNLNDRFLGILADL